MDEMKLHAVDRSGNPLEPRDYVVPIMREIFPGCLEIVGTGFYISRYGLFLTAYHALKTLIDNKKRILNVGYICHPGMDDDIYLRRILQANFFPSVDLAVGQADNYSNKYPTNALENKRVQLAAKVPAPDSVVFTYA
jgi:hypothetical protein